MTDQFDHIGHACATSVQHHWESKRSEMVQWLIKEKKYNPNGAKKAVDNFIQSMVFVAETCAEATAKKCRDKSAAAPLPSSETPLP